MACRQIVVMGCIPAEDYENDARWACISVASTAEMFVPIHRQRRKGLLQLAFADIDRPLPGLVHFNDDHAHDILDFVTHWWSKIDTLMVHCEAGLSRSPAIAAAISRLKYGKDREFFAEPYLPNRLVYRTLLEVAAGREDYSEPPV